MEPCRPPADGPDSGPYFGLGFEVVASGKPQTRGEGRSLPKASPVRYRQVTKRYPGASTDAVHELELDIPAGEICVLVGPSGCGKTTALRMANRTVEMTSGDIEIDGRSVRDRDPSELRREIGYVIQQIGLFPHRTVTENIATVPGLLDWDRERISRRVSELMDLIGLDPDFGDRYPAQLSGGQQQRVGVARALAVDPPVMLMDEPFGAIDPINRTRLQNEFLRLQAEIGKTVLFVTHDVDEAIKMGDRIAVLRKGGELAQFATPSELLASPADRFVEDFVGSDRALKRLSLIPITEVDLWEAVTVREGDDAATARRELERSEQSHAVLVDDDGQPRGWITGEGLEGEIVTGQRLSPTDPVIDVRSTLRDGLSALLQNGSQYAPVVDDDGRTTGILSMEIISDFLASGEDTKVLMSAASRSAQQEVHENRA